MNIANKKLTEQEMRELWYFYEAGQIKDLTQEDIRQINDYIKEKPEECKDMWEIGSSVSKWAMVMRQFKNADKWEKAIMFVVGSFIIILILTILWATNQQH